jgi:hypothetical protein
MKNIALVGLLLLGFGCTSMNKTDAALAGYEFVSSVTIDQQVVDVFRHKHQSDSWMGKRSFQAFGQIDSSVYMNNLKAIELVSECDLVPATVMNAGPTTTILVDC